MSNLEKELLKWFSKEYPEFKLDKTISSLEVSDREYTGGGFVTSFTENKIEGCSSSFNLDGPLVKASILEIGAETTLVISNGQIDCLDVLVIGCGNIEELETFNLVAQEINYIDDTNT